MPKSKDQQSNLASIGKSSSFNSQNISGKRDPVSQVWILYAHIFMWRPLIDGVSQLVCTILIYRFMLKLHTDKSKLNPQNKILQSNAFSNRRVVSVIGYSYIYNVNRLSQCPVE